MAKSSKTEATTQARARRPEGTIWVTVPVNQELHGDVRAAAVRRHLDWPDVFAEAMRLWLAHSAANAA